MKEEGISEMNEKKMEKRRNEAEEENKYTQKKRHHGSGLPSEAKIWSAS